VFGLKRKLPSKYRPALVRDERVLAWALATANGGDASAVVVTTLGLWLPGVAERLGWHQIHKATWAASKLTVIPAVEVSDAGPYRVMADGAPIVVTLSDPGDVPAKVRDRVTKSVAFTSHHPLPVGGVRVVGRRVVGSNGLAWNVRYDEGTDVADPDVIGFTAELVAEASAPTEPE
jgi:hypothetical protein